MLEACYITSLHRYVSELAHLAAQSTSRRALSF